MKLYIQLLYNIYQELTFKMSLHKPICLYVSSIHLQLTIYCSEAEDDEAILLRSWSPSDDCGEDGGV